MPEFAFGVDPFRKGTSANPYPPDTPHSQINDSLTLTNPGTSNVFTDYGVIPPGGSLTVPGVTPLIQSLIAAGVLDSDVIPMIPQAASVFGVVIVEAEGNDGSGATPIMSGSILANGTVGPDRPIAMVPVLGHPSQFNGLLEFPAFPQNAPQGSLCTFNFTLSVQGGMPTSTVTFDIAVFMALAVINFELSDADQFLWTYYPVHQDSSTGFWVVPKNSTAIGPTVFPPTLYYPNGGGQGVTITIYSETSTDPSLPIGARASLVLEYE